MNAIEIKNLSKDFKEVKAVNSINLTIKEGELYGLLGVNGAGKTTTIKMLSGLLKPTSGDALILGYSIDKDIDKIKEFINVSQQETSIATNLSVKENLRFIGEIYGMPKDKLKNKLEEIIKQTGLESVLNRRAGKLSGGWQRRLSIAMGLITDPKILFLDEPTVGLDVLARRELWKLITKLKGQMTIILTTHYLEEAEALCDNLAIMVNGSVKATGTVKELLDLTQESNLENAFVKIAMEDK